MTIIRVGLDTAKHVFQVHGVVPAEGGLSSVNCPQACVNVRSFRTAAAKHWFALPGLPSMITLIAGILRQIR